MRLGPDDRSSGLGFRAESVAPGDLVRVPASDDAKRSAERGAWQTYCVDDVIRDQHGLIWRCRRIDIDTVGSTPTWIAASSEALPVRGRSCV